MRSGLLVLALISIALAADGGASAAASPPRHCSTDQLRAAAVFSTGAMGNEIIDFRLENRGVRCLLRGYPSVRALAPDGRLVPAREQRTREPFPGGLQAPLGTVVLARGGFVYFGFGYYPVYRASTPKYPAGHTCTPVADSVRITPPGASGSLTVKLKRDMRRFGGLGVPQISFCGQVFRVGPVAPIPRGARRAFGL